MKNLKILFFMHFKYTLSYKSFYTTQNKILYFSYKETYTKILQHNNEAKK